MSVYIKVSYERDEELTAIADGLKSLPLRLEIAPQKGKYKRAYFKEKPIRQPLEVQKIEEEIPTM